MKTYEQYLFQQRQTQDTLLHPPSASLADITLA